VNAVLALVLLLLALVTAPVRHLLRGQQPWRSAVLADVDVQVHLGDPACVAELESIVWKTLSRAQKTWAPLPLPVHRVVIGAGCPAAGRADIYDDFVELADNPAGDSKPRRRVVVSLGVRDGTRDLDGWEIAGALAAQIQVLVDDQCREHRSLSAPAAAVVQTTARLARPAALDVHLTDTIERDQHPAQPEVAPAAAPPDTPVAEEVPRLAELLATVQKGQPLVAAGPSSNGAHQ
jgi:hypothetical protein